MPRLLLVVVVICVLMGGVYFAGRSGTNPDAYTNDFNVYYHAAREIIAGRDPYQNSLGEWTPYLYPPLLTELLIPLAVLPLPVAAYIWFLINAGSIVAAAWMSATLATTSGKGERRLGESPAGTVVLAACAVLVVLRFVLDNLDLGQVNAVVAMLAVAHVYLYARDRRILSAVALVLAASIKLTPAVLLVYHIAKLRLKFAAVCVALLVAVTALSFLPFGAGSAKAFGAFVNRTVRNEQGYDLADAGNQSLRGAVARLTERPAEQPDSRKPADAVTLLISMVFLGVAIFAAFRTRSELAASAPFFCSIVLLSPLSWKAHFVIFILPSAYLLARLNGSAKVARWLIVAALVAAFALFNLTSPKVIGLAAAEWADTHSFVLFGALVIYAVSVTAAVTPKFGKQQHVC